MILVAATVLVRSWIGFLSGNYDGPRIKPLAMAWVTGITITMIGSGVYALLH
jgi:hypothetical protein